LNICVTHSQPVCAYGFGEYVTFGNQCMLDGRNCATRGGKTKKIFVKN
jgi:hypothetical protein